MKSAIHIFGHDGTFDSDSIQRYIKKDIFKKGYDRRYRHNLLRNNAEIIVLSHAGEAYGHFEITGRDEPNANDKKEWERTKRVYFVSKSHSYKKPVNLQALGITQIRFGKPISAAILEKIQKRAGKVTPHNPRGA